MLIGMFVTETHIRWRLTAFAPLVDLECPNHLIESVSYSRRKALI